ncbi:hypothetical protein BDR26DRAFT_1012188 [Obelidium mucronatum]|nr:hypothetical protein BDR26DRAFT_1012188 [Obelidium mucronatum]
MTSSAEAWLISTNNSMGMIAFAMVLMMFGCNMYQIDTHPRTWVRSMVYLDALAFLILYVYQCNRDAITSYALKYGYIIHKSLVINNVHKRIWPCYFTSGVSLGLYWLYMLQSYGFGEAVGCTDAPLDGNWALIALYILWTTVDFVATLAMVRKITSVIANSTELVESGMGHFHTQNKLENEVKVFNVYKMREEVRLLLCVGGMGGVSALAIVRVVRPEWGIPAVNKIIFVFVQLLLLLGSKKVDVLALTPSQMSPGGVKSTASNFNPQSSANSSEKSDRQLPMIMCAPVVGRISSLQRGARGIRAADGDRGSGSILRKSVVGSE